jgi:hypothetical protein
MHAPGEPHKTLRAVNYKKGVTTKANIHVPARPIAYQIKKNAAGIGNRHVKTKVERV